MGRTKERYVVDKQGKRVGVILDIDDYEKLLADLEELEAIRAYDAAKSSGDEIIRLEQAIKEIEQGRTRIRPNPPAGLVELRRITTMPSAPDIRAPKARSLLHCMKDGIHP